MKAVTCPVCDGTGNIEKTLQPYNGTRTTCHGCYGKGWVEVYDELGENNVDSD